MAMVKRFEVWLVSLDPSQGYEIKKTRPCLIISPDEMNNFVKTLIIAPMTSANKEYPTRVSVNFEGKAGQIVLDQIRSVDRSRLKKKLGSIDQNYTVEVSNILQEMFSI